MPIEIKKSQNPVKYEDAISFMEDRLKDIDLKKVDDLIWVLEHDHIYTSGTSYNENEIIDKSINIIKTNRGGKITYHGPGQITVYFLLDIKRLSLSIRQMVQQVESVMINCLARSGIMATRLAGAPGVYVDNKKIGALGLRVTRGRTYHGMSLNLSLIHI